MTEKLSKRIGLLEQKLNPPKPLFDIVGEIRLISIEKQRLLDLPSEAYLLELAKPPKTKTEKIARIGAANQKHFLALSPEEKQRYLGYPTSNFTPEEFAEIQQTQALIKTSQTNWVTSHLREIHSRKL